MGETLSSPAVGAASFGVKRALGVTIASALFAFGCAQLIGAEERSLRQTQAAEDAGDDAFVEVTADSGPLVVEVPDAGDPNACPTGTKRCNGACVSATDPQYGCAATSCDPCSVPNAKAQTCEQGQCAAATCKAGFGACISKTAGCTEDLSAPETCGSCLVSCPGNLPICSPGGCAGTCEAPNKQCGQSCVDITTHPNNCGVCGKVCPAAANGDPECADSECVVACRAGYGHCDGTKTGPCVPLQVLYVDTDRDGFGDVKKPSQLGCPGIPLDGYANVAGDCHDENPEVFPGQTRYFPPAYPVPGTGLKSWDWDCSGVETEQPGVVHFSGCTPDCTGQGIGPSGSGRTGPGVNDYCGSTRLFRCSKLEASCVVSEGIAPVNPCR
jgi:hypothetical protein